MASKKRSRVVGNGTYVAHVRKSEDGKLEAQTLDDHLEGVRDAARRNARKFGKHWVKFADVVATAHDIGKATVDFQKHIRAASGYDSAGIIDCKAKHAAHGAALLEYDMKAAQHPFSPTIAGHHGGMKKQDRTWEDQDINVSDVDADFRSLLSGVISKAKMNRNDYRMFRDPKDRHLAARMLYSCLVDADYEDTERFMRGSLPEVKCLSLSELHKRLNSKMEKLKSNTDLGKIRTGIWNACSEADASMYHVLEVPTGGGKTFASLGLALTLAKRYRKDRVIVGIPYTSIIEQTAKVYREALGLKRSDPTLLEHHSLFDVDAEGTGSKDTESYAAGKATKALLRSASERWNVPLIVTTYVQFFDSLHSNKPSKCRKVHNIANSVVVLDEVQTLPLDKLFPLLHTIKSLAENYGVLFVFCTATQPAVYRDSSDGEYIDINNVNHVIPNAQKLAKKMMRTLVQKHKDGTFTSWHGVADEIVKSKQCLCIVNSKQNAIDLYNELPVDSRVYLTTNMCAAHRSDVLDDVKKMLTAGEPVHLVSTSLIEAGVDIDFPVVFRELCGLDSIVQAAGRCNREGKSSKQDSVVHVFPYWGKNPKYVEADICCINQVSKELKLGSKPTSRWLEPATIKAYFDQRYENKGKGLDACGVLSRILGRSNDELDYEELSKKMRLIDNDDISIIVPYGESESLVAKLRSTFDKHGFVDSALLRRLRRYAVNVRRNDSRLVRYSDRFEPVLNDGPKDILVLLDAKLIQSLYSDEVGFRYTNNGKEEYEDYIL